MDATDVLLLAVMTVACGGCLYSGVRGLSGEMRLVRRVGELGAPDGFFRRAEGPVRRLGKFLLGGDDELREIRAALHVAGYDSPSAPRIFVWCRLGATVAAWGAAALAVAITGGWRGTGPLIPWFAAGSTYLLSKRALRWSAARRRRRIRAEIPFLLDVFLMMLESGVSLDQTFRTFVRSEGRAAPLSRRAIAALIEDIDRGMPYDVALDRWSERLGVNGSRELASLFKRNLAHGSELSAALRAMAREFSERRVAAAREAVGRKSAQMSVVMILFFLPATFIVLGGPAFVTLVRTLSEAR